MKKKLLETVATVIAFTVFAVWFIIAILLLPFALAETYICGFFYGRTLGHKPSDEEMKVFYDSLFLYKFYRLYDKK